ncbi:MAG: hypothetical protein ABIR02_08210 [Novosphingobium sp.]
MSTDREVRLSPEDQALKLATSEAVRAAGGQEFVGREVGRRQSRISDYCSNSTAEFMPLNIARHVEALGKGAPGHPHITRALARAVSATIVGEAAASFPGLDDLGDWMALVARENADLASALAGEDLALGVEALSPAARARISIEARELIARAEALVRALGVSDGDATVSALHRRDSS